MEYLILEVEQQILILDDGNNQRKEDMITQLRILEQEEMNI